MGIHVKNGTPMHGPSLCETCVRLMSKGFRESEILVVCGAVYRDHLRAISY